MWRLAAIARIARLLPRWVRQQWDESRRRSFFMKLERQENYLDENKTN